MKAKVFAPLLALCLLAGCTGPNGTQDAQPQTSTIFAMDTVMELQVYGDESPLSEAEALIHSLEDSLSVTDENSDIFALNRDGQAALGADAASLLETALALCERTGGALDVTVYPVVRTWGFTTGEYRVPDTAELGLLLKNVDYRRVSLKDGFAVLGPGQQVDLGSVAKGYTSNAIIDLWREAGVTSALLNLGGNVHALGAKPDGSPWRVAIQDPFSDGYLGLLEIVDRAVITSGGYERYFERDGVTYWHIIDPATGYPADSGLASVTIVGADGAMCDGLSTALFVMGLEKAAAHWRETSDFEAVFVTSGKQVYITEGLSDIFAPLGDYEQVEIQVIPRD